LPDTTLPARLERDVFVDSEFGSRFSAAILVAQKSSENLAAVRSRQTADDLDTCTQLLVGRHSL